MANEQNLTPFKKGNRAGVGHGRPKGSRSMTTLLKEALEKDITLNGKTKKTSEWIMQALISKAGKGDIKAIREIMDRIEGKAVQRTEITGADGNAIEVKRAEGLQELDERLAKAIEHGAGEDGAGASET